MSEGRKRLSDEVQLANDAKQWVEAIQEYANITELDAATLNRLIKEIVVHERIDEDKTRHISIEIHFNLKPIPEVGTGHCKPVKYVCRCKYQGRHHRGGVGKTPSNGTPASSP